MKHTNEVQAVLTAIFAINRTSEHEDKDITLVLDYAFRRFFGANTNLLLLSCIGKTKEQIMPEVTDNARSQGDAENLYAIRKILGGI